MAGNYQNILGHQECISEERLLGYIEGSLSPQEANRVEQHLLECELCSDALEGLKMLHPDKSRAITAELNRKIDERIENARGKVVSFSSFYRIAAIIVLAALFGGGYLLMKNTKEKDAIALNQKIEPAKDSAAAQFESPAGTVSENAGSDSQKEIVSVAPKFSIDQKKQAGKQGTYNTTKEIKDETKSRDDVAKPESDVRTSQSDTFFTGNEVALSKVENSNANRQQSSNAIESYHSTQAAPAAAEREASGAMPDNKIKVEELKYKSRKTSVADDEKSIFDRAKSNYDLKKFELAANDFEKLVKDTASTYYDDSKWFLANCYMRTNRTAKARKLLQEISNSNSIHKREAFGLLQEN